MVGCKNEEYFNNITKMEALTKRTNNDDNMMKDGDDVYGQLVIERQKQLL